MSQELETWKNSQTKTPKNGNYSRKRLENSAEHAEELTGGFDHPPEKNPYFRPGDPVPGAQKHFPVVMLNSS